MNRRKVSKGLMSRCTCWKMCVLLFFIYAVILVIGPACTYIPRYYRPLQFTKEGDNSGRKYNLTLQDSVQNNSKRNRFKFINNPDICRDDVVLLVAVISALSNVERRNVIRRTWGSVFKSKVNLKIVFVLGKTTDVYIQKEQDAHQDLIQADFEDSYETLQLKILAVLQWTLENCPRVEHLLKIDDDVFLNTNVFFSKLSSVNSETRFFYGRVLYLTAPFRSTKSKWVVSIEQYPYDQYPPFVHGPAYVMSRDLLSDVHACANHYSKLNLEDVFITGICGYLIKANHIDDCGFNTGKPHYELIFREDLIISHRLSPDEMELLWNRLQKWNSVKYLFRFIGIPLSWIQR